MVSVIDPSAPHRFEAQFCEAPGKNDIPNPLMADVIGVAIIAGNGMAIIDFKEPFAFDAHDVLGCERPLEVRMIDMRDYGLPRLFTLIEDCVDVILKHFVSAVAVLRG